MPFLQVLEVQLQGQQAANGRVAERAFGALGGAAPKARGLAEACRPCLLPPLASLPQASDGVILVFSSTRTLLFAVDRGLSRPVFPLDSASRGGG